MAEQFVVGLFQSRGTAEDAVNRLKTEGVVEQDIGLVMLRETAPTPRVLEPALAVLEVDPLVLGDVRRTYAPYIKNGETAIFVRTRTADEVELAVAVIRLYAPVKIRLVEGGDGAALGHDVL